MGEQLRIGEYAPESPAKTAAPARLFPATREHAGGILLRTATADELSDLETRAIARRGPGPIPRGHEAQKVLDSWVGLLSPYFDGHRAVNLTGTYRDDYGQSHGLMLPRNVRRDFLRAVEHERPHVFTPWCLGIERHNTGRDVLHFHAMLGGDWSDDEITRLKAFWTYTRGWAVAKPVSATGGCVAYCAKHLLKRGDFDFRVSGARPGSRQARREQER